jgi:hypothetical protein
VDRDEILAAIKRTADENGGKPLGRIRFQSVTGIGKPDWIRYWPRFSDAQREAGFAPNELFAHTPMTSYSRRRSNSPATSVTIRRTTSS